MMSNKLNIFAMVLCGLMVVAMAAEAPNEDQKAEGSFLHGVYGHPGVYGGYGLGYGGYGLGYGLGYGGHGLGYYGRR